MSIVRIVSFVAAAKSLQAIIISQIFFSVAFPPMFARAYMNPKQFVIRATMK